MSLHSSSGSSNENCGVSQTADQHHHHHRLSLHELIRHFRRAHWRLSGDSDNDSQSKRRSSLDSASSKDSVFRSRSKSLDGGGHKVGLAAALARGRAALRRNTAVGNSNVPVVGECEATYRVYESIVKEGKCILCNLSFITSIEDTIPKNLYSHVVNYKYK
jgi:hypothetical protein